MQCDIRQYWDLSDEDIQAVYDQAERGKLLDRAAYDVGLNRKLFHFFARRAECFCAVYAEKRLAGFFYLSRFEGATARLHLALAAAPDGVRQDLARQALDWCFSTFDFKSLFIVAPAGDAEAAELWTSLGAQTLAEVPGLCWLEKKKKNVPGRLCLLPTTVGGATAR